MLFLVGICVHRRGRLRRADDLLVRQPVVVDAARDARLEQHARLAQARVHVAHGQRVDDDVEEAVALHPAALLAHAWLVALERDARALQGDEVLQVPFPGRGDAVGVRHGGDGVHAHDVETYEHGGEFVVARELDRVLGEGVVGGLERRAEEA